MLTLLQPRTQLPRSGDVPQLENGAVADQPTFHRWYRTTSENFRAELIGGQVVVSSPVKVDHCQYTSKVGYWMETYVELTPGLMVCDNGTIILGPSCEPQPDRALVVLKEFGGRCWIDDDGYLVGSPDTIAEVAGSSASIDLHRKKADYERHGVREYIVVELAERRIHWFVLRDNAYVELPPDADGIYRSSAFPGLWLDAEALFELDNKRIAATVRQGAATAEHAAFVERFKGSSA